MGGVMLQGGAFRVATFIPDVTIEAVAQDALGITGFPCEDGVTRADHSFKLPVRLEMVAGWSDSTAGQDGYIRQIYQKLLALQATRQPFDMYTPRRAHKNMLMETLTDPIGAATMSAMVPRITFRELIISRTQESGASGNGTTAGVGDGAPAANQPVTNVGNVETQGVGSQAFAGSFNPGTYSPDGGSVGNGSFGLNTPGADVPLADNPNLSGLSPPMEITLPEQTVDVPPAEGPGGLQAAGPDQYNMFGGGP